MSTQRQTPPTVQFVHNDQGTPVAVTMSLETFKRLATPEAREMLEDQYLGELALEAADGPFYPFELTVRKANGENPLKVYREWRGLTQQELAEKVDVSTNYISQIETGKKQASRKLQMALAKVLGIDYDMIETAIQS
ncbi:helix-turn-helix transcriptional regulator [Thalassospira sp.]|uniref:helix-turn-helix transcriptional regulator n=1 Tax=Thalassospira sp. TaxID=1912094 RepID=UPI0027326C85|nr:helix-turn-helix transcriptional regulator [Thalassospira sp.]MDP2699420.1 helix-turn-helix transcriptional regulator [Thalassospira sp.]